MWKLIPSFWAAFSASPLVRPQSASTGKPRAYKDQGKGGHFTCLIVDSHGLPSKQGLVTRQQGRCQRYQHPAIPLTSWLPHIHLWNKPLFIFYSIFTITYLFLFLLQALHCKASLVFIFCSDLCRASLRQTFHTSNSSTLCLSVSLSSWDFWPKTRFVSFLVASGQTRQQVPLLLISGRPCSHPPRPLLSKIAEALELSLAL